MASERTFGPCGGMSCNPLFPVTAARPCDFSGPKNLFFAERIVYSRRESKVSKVLVRIQYALFVALFVLMSAVGPLPEREGSDRTFAALSADRSSDIPSPADFCFAVPCLGFEISDLPDSGCGLRSLLRCYDFGSAGSALTVSDAAGGVCSAVRRGFLAPPGGLLRLLARAYPDIAPFRPAGPKRLAVAGASRRRFPALFSRMPWHACRVNSNKKQIICISRYSWS